MYLEKNISHYRITFIFLNLRLLRRTFNTNIRFLAGYYFCVNDKKINITLFLHAKDLIVNIVN